MSGWTCSYQLGEQCTLLKKPCDPGDKGCVLYGKALFSNPNSPSNEALKRREALERARKERGYE
ncbi:MAG: hypothetical protein C6I00_04375 [Nitratiruptor sp.]|nr:hypothetical protein [Nitratiruptor sp.]NPA84022.1 hypothetical protein [Campylobacterota bacterium]